ncbi:MAG: hypothetical protein IJP43_09915 [Oscillospiraceae bacterium]|nr:hypothetical protein [Oscillospiraceae bacterium]
MTNKKVTRRALLMSVTSLLICISMLLGTTFAWFTDEVTSGVNQIVAGNLDVELYHVNSSTAPAATDADKKVTASTMLFDSSMDATHLWEPGAMAYETFTVKNVGSLALKYNFNMVKAGNNTVNGTEDSLLDVLKVAVIDGTPATLTREAIAADGSINWTTLKEFSGIASEAQELYPSSDTTAGHDSVKTCTVVVYWPQSENDNTYNLKNGKYASDATEETVGKLWVKLGIKLVATQLKYENDSFDNTYDESTTLPAVAIASITSANGTEDLTITKTGVIESATIPAAAANAVFTEMANTTSTENSNELTMNLNVAKTGETNTATSTTVDLEIDMTAVMKTTTTAGTTTNTKDITSLSSYVTINYNLGTGKNVTGVTHNGNAMTELASAEAVLPAENETGYNANGYYFYDATSGILTIKTNSFSPFAVTFAKNTGRTATITQPVRTWLKDGKYVLPYGKVIHSGASADAVAAASEAEFNTCYDAASAFVNEMNQYFTADETARTITINSVDGLKRLYMVDEYCSAKNAMACKDRVEDPYSPWYYAPLHEPNREFIVKVANDLDLGGSIDANGNIVNNWTPTECSLDIDFQNYKVSNLVSDTYVGNLCGLFAEFNGTVSNLTLENVTILGLTGNKETGAGAISGSARGDLINCAVKNAIITTSKWAGAFAAFSYGSIENCTAENVEITCGYKIGGLCGQSSTANDGHSGLKYTGNKLKDVKVVCDLSLSGKDKANIGKLIGYLQNDASIYGNTFTNLDVTPTNTEHDGLVGVIGDGYTVSWSN